MARISSGEGISLPIFNFTFCQNLRFFLAPSAAASFAYGIMHRQSAILRVGENRAERHEHSRDHRGRAAFFF